MPLINLLFNLFNSRPAPFRGIAWQLPAPLYWRYWRYRRQPFRLLLLTGALFFLLPSAPGSQSLWQDHNPYSAGGGRIVPGVILKLSVDEPVRVVYEYENATDENIEVTLLPDSAITSFLSPAESSRSIVKRYSNRLDSRNRVSFSIAVRIEALLEGETVAFSGRKVLVQESGISRQQIEVAGQIHAEDIGSGRTIRSSDVADLQIVFVGAPIPRSRNLPLKEEAGEDPDSPPRPSAQPTEEEKQQILLEYLNRLLGETANP